MTTLMPATRKASLKKSRSAVIGGLLGLVAAVGLGGSLTAPAAMAADAPAKYMIEPEGGWSFSGVFGRYDRKALQRGFQVYSTICAGCHSMNLLSYRNLGEEGGPEFTEEEVRAIAAQNQVPAGPDEFGSEVDEFGLPRVRPAKPNDRFRNPYANEEAARAANGGALPPDLSVINKARHYGADYTYSLLLGYKEAPNYVEMRTGMYYNIYFPGGQIAMPPQLMDGMIEYTDGTEATKEQMAHDVTQFLEWAGEPTMEERKKLGTMVMIYLFIFAVLLYISYRRLWRNIEH